MILAENKSKIFTQLHTLFAIVAAGFLYFFLEPEFSREFFLVSLVLNIYLRLLILNFSVVIFGKSLNSLGSIFSALRAVIVAAVFALFILKFNFNLWALALAFTLYKVVLLLGGFFINKTDYASHSN